VCVESAREEEEVRRFGKNVVEGMQENSASCFRVLNLVVVFVVDKCCLAFFFFFFCRVHHAFTIGLPWIIFTLGHGEI